MSDEWNQENPSSAESTPEYTADADRQSAPQEPEPQSTYQQEPEPQSTYQQEQEPQSAYRQEPYPQNPYQQNPYQQNAYQQNAYRQNPYPYQQNAYRQGWGYPNGQPYYGQTSSKSTGIGFGVASLVLGILSVFTFMCCINFLLALLAIIFGVVQIVRCEKRGMAIAGIVTAVVSIVVGLIFWIYAFAVAGTDMTDPDSLWQEYLEEYEQEYQQDYYNSYFPDNEAM